MKNKEEIKRVALYIRVSTDKQAKEGDSLEAQEEALMKYCKDKKYIIVDKYIDGGESGQKIKRTNLQRLLKDVKDHKIDLILMTKLDRWFRSIADFYKVIEIIKDNHVDWKTIWEDYDTTTASGEFWLNMSLAMGQLEAKRTAERINAVFDYKYRVQKTVCSGAAPYGYKIVDKKYVIDEKRVNYVIELYKYYLKTNCLNESCCWFRDNCEARSNYTIKKILRNPAYIGKFKKYQKDEIVENFIPPIMEESLWNDVQNAMNKNRKKYESNPNSKRHNVVPYIFSGLLYCAECNHTLSAKCNLYQKHYYHCRHYSDRRFYTTRCSNKKCTNEQKLEEYLLNNIIKIIKKKKLIEVEIRKKQKSVKDNTNILKNKLKKMTELYLEDLIDKDYYKEEYNKIQAQIINIENNKINETDNIDYDKILQFLEQNFLNVYKSLDNLEKRRIWSSVLDRVIVDGNEVKDIVVY